MLRVGDILKFKGLKEPCIIYRLQSLTEMFVYSPQLKKWCNHINIEVLGYVPVEILEPASEHKENRYAIDVWKEQRAKGNQ